MQQIERREQPTRPRVVAECEHETQPGPLARESLGQHAGRLEGHRVRIVHQQEERPIRPPGEGDEPGQRRQRMIPRLGRRGAATEEPAKAPPEEPAKAGPEPTGSLQLVAVREGITSLLAHDDAPVLVLEGEPVPWTAGRFAPVPGETEFIPLPE